MATNKRKLYIKPANRSFKISERAWEKLACYKLFRPPETKIKLGRHTLTMADIFPWPEKEQWSILDIPESVIIMYVDDVAKRCGLNYDGTTSSKERNEWTPNSNPPKTTPSSESGPTHSPSGAQNLF